jgi:hypothetical protein
MAEAGYRIIDEPQPGPLARVVVDPMWPLFGFMFGGAWLGWIWYIVNGLAVGSPTRKKEIALVVLGIVGSVALALLFGWLVTASILPASLTWAAILVITLWKLGVTYWLYELQRRSFELYRYFGGAVRSGFLVVLVGYFARSTVAGLVANGLWVLVVI